MHCCRINRWGMEKIERISLTEKVAKRIQSLIDSGNYTVGDRLPTESEFCEQLGVGRSTLREAFRMLQALGMIELRPGIGAFLKHKDIAPAEAIKKWFLAKETEVCELMEVRMAIEPLAARLAIVRGRESQVARLHAIHEAFSTAVREQDVIGMATLDESFHNAIMEASNNDILIRIGNILADALRAYRTRSFAVSENITHALLPHERILQAIMERNKDGVGPAILAHLEVTLEDMQRVTEKKAEDSF